jgi:REase_AHJR-like
MISRIESVATGTEAQVMKTLRARYEGDGFVFTDHPRAATLPDFFGGYTPDAIAVKGDEKIVIEVKSRQRPSSEPVLTAVNRLFEGHPDWRLHIVFTNPDPLQELALPLPPLMAIRDGISEARTLIVEGHLRAAFVMGWSLLEAALRAQRREASGPGRPPSAVVETAAMNGLIDPDTARGLRDLIALRNRLVHGDLSAQPEAVQVERLLAGVEEALNAEAPAS